MYKIRCAFVKYDLCVSKMLFLYRAALKTTSRRGGGASTEFTSRQQDNPETQNAINVLIQP